VEHIVVVGHYGCGGVAAALDGRSHGLLDNWLRHVKDVAARHADELEALGPETRYRRLVELNAIAQARNLCHTSIVQAAWARGQRLTVRAWVYGLDDGVLRELAFAVNGPEEMQPSYRLEMDESQASHM
jgi:carbonic anhydrase